MKMRIPKFKSEAEEQEFWATADSTEYVDWKDSNRVVLSKLKPSHRYPRANPGSFYATTAFAVDLNPVLLVVQHTV